MKDATLVPIKKDQQDAIEKVYGCLQKTLDTNKIINSLRGKTIFNTPSGFL